MKISGMCRGDGRIYIKTIAEPKKPDSTFTLESRNQYNDNLPTALYPIHETNDKQPTEFVVVLPVLLTDLVLTFNELDSAGEVISSSKTTIKPTTAALNSKMNYLFNMELVETIRGFDDDSFLASPNISLFSLTEDGDYSIIHAVIVSRQRLRDDADICILDDMGKPLDVRVEVLHDSIIRPHGDDRLDSDPRTPQAIYNNIRICADVELHQRMISLRIPRSLKHFCLYLKGDSGLTSFLTPEDWELEHLEKINRDNTLNAGVDPRYDSWFREQRVTRGNLKVQSQLTHDTDLLFTIIVPIYKTPILLFEKMLDSVLNQSYANFELILVNASPEDIALTEKMKRSATKDKRIRIVEMEKNLGIVGNTNAGIKEAEGEFICFFDHDDLLEYDALFEYYRGIQQNANTDLLYCDEDKVSEDGKVFFAPYFKPDFNIDLLRSNNYICHFLCIRRSLVDRLELSTPDVEGAQDYDLTLKACEKARHIKHIDKPLYHWRATANSTASSTDNKGYANNAGKNAIQSHINRLGLKAEVLNDKYMFRYRVHYDIGNNHLVSIIIPNKDNISLLDQCLTSILKKTCDVDYEILIVENNSEDEGTFEYYKTLDTLSSRIRVTTWTGPFNYSKINNYGAQQAKGDYLLFLNNDTKVMNEDWLENMLGIAARDDVGAVGAKLHYKDGTIQHAGIVIENGIPMHIMNGIAENDVGYFNNVASNTDVSAVTAACMMTKASDFTQVGGFAGEFPIAYNDIDYCLKLRERQLLIVQTPYSKLYHFESMSREYESTPERRVRNAAELARFQEKWPSYTVYGDPYYNKNFLKGSAYCKLGQHEWLYR